MDGPVPGAESRGDDPQGPSRQLIPKEPLLNSFLKASFQTH